VDPSVSRFLGGNYTNRTSYVMIILASHVIDTDVKSIAFVESLPSDEHRY
jgi:hypothetical protein